MSLDGARVESPVLSRVWRPYSMARAPGGDGGLELHVRKEYMGVRTADKSYDRGGLRALASRTGVTGGGRRLGRSGIRRPARNHRRSGPQGTVADVVGADRGASRRDHEVYIGGPPAMVEATRERLASVPAEQSP